VKQEKGPEPRREKGIRVPPHEEKMNKAEIMPNLQKTVRKKKQRTKNFDEPQRYSEKDTEGGASARVVL